MCLDLLSLILVSVGFPGCESSNTEALTFWPPDVKSQLIGKDPGAGKD